MNPTSHLVLTHLRRTVQYTVVRYVRGAVTVSLKEPRRKPKPRKPFESNDAMFRKNEGIGRRLRTFMEDGELEKDISDIDVDDIEPQPINYARAYREHFEEMTLKELEKHKHAVIRKHFKEEKLPNMLTYGEKQQMKRLHFDDPDLWTVDKLASSFPASPAIVQKILKADWKPKNKEQLLSHDRTVEKNWKLFRANKLKFNDEDLQRHLAKFTDRHSIIYTEAEIKHLLHRPTIRPEVGEFGRIIKNYKKLIGEPDGNNLLIEGETSITINPGATQRNAEGVPIFKNMNFSKGRKPITLDEYRQRLLSGHDLTALDKLIVEGGDEKLSTRTEQNKDNNNNNNNNIANNNNVNSYPDVGNSRHDSVQIHELGTKGISKQVTKSSADYLTDNIRLRINIPKELWKEGMTYKIGDCFYDDDGLFLYRVPGLVS